MFQLLAIECRCRGCVPDAPNLAVGEGENRLRERGLRLRPAPPDPARISRSPCRPVIPSRSSALRGPASRRFRVILFRFYDVDGGRVTIDGQDTRDVTQESLRAAIGIVPQDTVLFNDTVYYNIAYGRPSASPAEIEHAARLARIHDFIMEMPDGYETRVGEAGPQAVGRRKAARGHRAHHPEGAENSAVRRGDVGARFPYREGNPEKPARSLGRAHHADHRASLCRPSCTPKRSSCWTAGKHRRAGYAPVSLLQPCRPLRRHGGRASSRRRTRKRRRWPS